MDAIRTNETVATARVTGGKGVVAFVDCADEVRQDVLSYWLMRAGCRVRAGLGVSATGSRRSETDVLFTDRFGPRFHGHATIYQLKEKWPHLRVVIVGDGDATQSAQLSLANAAGADAVLPEPLHRQQVLELLERWS